MSNSQSKAALPDQSKLKVTVHDLATGSTETVELEMDETLKASIEADRFIAWCKCKHATDSHFKDDRECSCGIEKHHYHCTACGRVTQIG